MKNKIIFFAGIMWIPSWLVFFMATKASDFPKWASEVLPDIFWIGFVIVIGYFVWNRFIDNKSK